MRVFLAIPLLTVALTAPAADRELPIGRSSNDQMEIQADLLLSRDQIREALGPAIPGSDLGGNYVGVRVTVRPLTDTPVKIWRDDFTLISDKDGQRSTAFGPTQIAGSGTMVIKMTPGATVGTSMDRVPVWVGGAGGGMGTATVDQPTPEATVKDDAKKSDSPLLTALREKILPNKSVTEPVSGLLFFQIDGKVKPKNLELFYKTETGDRLGLRFTKK